jgi:Uma2 family endonuclease
MERMSLDEYLAWQDGSVISEWVDGEVVYMTPATRKHQDLGGLLEAVLRVFVETKRLGVILGAPFAMRVPGIASVREPDVLFIRGDRAHLLGDTYVDGAADLVIEIVSPESVGRDRGEKFVEYEAGGIPEYWLLDPERRQAEFYQLAVDGRYRVVAPDGDGVYRSAVVAGFWLRVDWLWQDPLPRTLDVLRELGVV